MPASATTVGGVMLKDFLRFLWKRDNDSAFVLIIGAAEYLNDHDLLEAAAYLRAVLENRKISGRNLP